MKGTQLAADIKFYLDYSKWMEGEDRIETWEDSVRRVMGMHRNNPKFAEAFKNPRFVELFDMAERMYLEKLILGSNRALQFGGDPIMKHNSKMYNCLASHADRPAFFQEAAYWLMSGCGVGYSVQYRHVRRLPAIIKRTKGTKTFVVPDSIEGWADAMGVLMSSYFVENSTFPEYAGYEVKFDFSQIREKGSKISGGFKAPGHSGLKLSLEKIEQLLEEVLRASDAIHVLLEPIHVYDIICHFSDAVLSGGVRRSASICVFSREDKDMMEAKTFQNFNPGAGVNPQRARSNNSVVLLRSETTKEIFESIIAKTREQGEPGFYFVDHLDQVPNPCVEIGMWPIAPNGKTGWQGCNLTVGNGRKATSKAEMMRMCIGLAVLGTIQAAYTDFRYVSQESKDIFEREALLGCGICGWLNNPDVLLNEENMREGANLIKQINAEVAKIIGINPAARTTCVKPDGNTGVLLEAISGAGGEKFPTYFRTMQINKEAEIAKYLKQHCPFMIEENVWSRTKSDYTMYIPVEADKKSVFEKDILGVKHLEIVKKIQQNWVEAGTRVEACVQPFLRHNVSNTVVVDNWDEVTDYLFENKEYFSGVSFLGTFGALDYKQAPFTPVIFPDEMLSKYGNAVVFASGLIVDGLHEFDNDLWDACMAVTKRDFVLEGTRRQVLLKKEWIRRAKQFARRHFKGDLQKMVYCLKELHLYHKWVEINRELKPMDLSKVQLKPEYTEVDTLGSFGCQGGQCEMPTDFLNKLK